MSFETPRPPSWVACQACGDEDTILTPNVRCRSCGGLQEVRHRTPGLPGPLLRGLFNTRCCSRGDGEASGVWRFKELVLPALPEEVIVRYPEGNTPLVFRERLADWAGVKSLRCKVEGMNPTGSFKDRGMTVAVSQARASGARAVVCASTGNTSASMATYAALAGLPAYVLVPAGQVAPAKLAQTLVTGARIVPVEGDFDACLRLLEEVAPAVGVHRVNSINPFRIEGQKTVMFEILQQLEWDPPEWVALPAGNLGNTAAVGKALLEAKEWGLLERLPRLLAVQAEGAAPFAAGFADQFATRHRVEATTRATAIRIGDPASWDRAATAIRETHGEVIAVPDEAIFEAKGEIDRAGIGCEPASAASVAGVRVLRARGTIAATDRVVAILTGHLLKDPTSDLAGAASLRPIPATAEALRSALA